MTYVFDLDGTLCTLTSGDYNNAEPFPDSVAKVNELYDQGHRIIIQTARGMGRSDNNAKFANEIFYELTASQLSKWGIKYHALFLGKPSGDYYVDDKAIQSKDFFGN